MYIYIYIYVYIYIYIYKLHIRPPSQDALKAVFDDVMKLDFDTIITAHGPPAANTAKERWAAALAKIPQFRAVTKADANKTPAA